MVKKILSFFWGQTYKNPKTSVLPCIEINLHNGKIHIDGANVNYSFGSLHHVFRKAIKQEIKTLRTAQSILILGFGAGSIAKIIRNEYKLKNIHLVGIEFEPEMIKLAKAQAESEDVETIEIHICDAQTFMQSNKKQFDAILIDLFVEKDIPSFCFEQPFISQVEGALTHKALLIWNTLDNEGMKTVLTNSNLNLIRKTAMQDENLVYFFKK